MTRFETDPFLNRVYHKRRYNCLHFAAEVWAAWTGEDYFERFRAMVEPSVFTIRHLGFRRLKQTVNPCIAFMNNIADELHIGVFVEGNLFHLKERGPEFMPIHVAVRGYHNVRYYR